MQKYLFIFFKFFKFFIFRYNIILPTSGRVLRNDFFFKDFYFFKKLNVNIFFFKLNILLLKRNSYFMGFSNSLIKLKKSKYRIEYKNIVFSKKNLSNGLTSKYTLSIGENKGNVKWSRRVFSNVLLILADWSSIYRKNLFFSKNAFFLNSSISCENYFFRKAKEKEILEFRRLGIEPFPELSESELNSFEYAGKFFLFESFFLNLGFSFENFFDFCIEDRFEYNWRYSTKTGLLSNLSDGMFKGTLEGNMSGFLLKKLKYSKSLANYSDYGISDFVESLRSVSDINVIDENFFIDNQNDVDVINLDDNSNQAASDTSAISISDGLNQDKLLLKKNLGPTFKEFKHKLYIYNKVNSDVIINQEREFFDFSHISLFNSNLNISNRELVSSEELSTFFLNVNNYDYTSFCDFNFNNKFSYMPRSRLNSIKKVSLLSENISEFSNFEGIAFCKFSGEANGLLSGLFNGKLSGKLSGKLIGEFSGNFKGSFTGKYTNAHGIVINYTNSHVFHNLVKGNFIGTLDGFFDGSIQGFIEGSADGIFNGFGSGKVEGKLSALALGNFNGKLDGKFNGKLDGSFNGRFHGYTNCESEKYNFPAEINDIGGLIKEELNFDNIKKDDEGKTELDHYNDWESYFFNEMSENITFEFIDTMGLFLNKIFLLNINKSKYCKSSFFFNFYFFNTFCNNFFSKNENTPLDFPYVKSLGYKEPIDIVNIQHNNNIILSGVNFNNIELPTKLYFFFKRNSLLVLKKKYINYGLIYEFVNLFNLF